MKFRDVFENAVACNAAGAGAVAGIGIGSQGEPPVKKPISIKRRVPRKNTRVVK